MIDPHRGDTPVPSVSPDDKNLLPALVAAVDLGSNSFHMKVARVIDGELQVVDRMREMVRLAAGLDDRNRLDKKTVTRALDCLRRFGQRLRDIPPASVRVVGTNTLRRARESRDFLAEAESALGHPIEIIAGREEARLIYLGVSRSGTQSDEQCLIVDIGGGSTELIIGCADTPLNMESLYMGCVSFSRRFFPNGKIRRRHFKAAQLAAAQELEPIEAQYRKVGWESVVGTSGTIRATEAIVRHNGWSGNGITAQSLQTLKQELIQAGSVEKIDMPGSQRERAPVFPGGLAILIAVFERLGVKRMVTSDGALREGVLFDLLGRLGEEDIREKTIQNLWSRFRVDTDQAARVAKTTEYLHTQVASAWKLRKRRYADCLSWAARLHEIGLDVAHSQYHKHGAYLLHNADMPGFSRQEQALTAMLVRSHRRKLSLDELRQLAAPKFERALYLCIILRLAVLLRRSRSSSPLPDIVAVAESGVLDLTFPSGWLEAHPLTAFELEEEAACLKRAEFELHMA